LVFACQSDTPDLPTLDDFENFFGQDVAGWLRTLLWWQRGTNQGTPKPLYNALVQLIQYMQASPKNTREEILGAFDNDTSFHEHHDDAGFQFLFKALHDDTQKALRPVMERFYTDILDAGFDKILANRFNRDSFTAAFWSSNAIMLICPACDTLRPEEKRERPDKDEEEETSKIYAEVDHFFPKSKYPFLSVHPYNLVPICSVCNKYYKSDQDPIDAHSDAPLSRCFLPYLRPAKDSGQNPTEDQIEVKISRTTQGTAYQVEIEDASKAFPCRVANLERLFKLSDRWLTRLRPQVVKRITERVVEWRSMLQFMQQPRDKMFLVQFLANLQKTCQGKIGQAQDQILWASYLGSCALGDEKELEALFTMFSQQAENPIHAKAQMNS
jgi:hypothetical protein